MMANVFYCNGQIYSFAPGQPGPGVPGVMQPVQPLSMPSNGANNGGQSHFGMTPSAAAAAMAQPQNKGLVADLCKIIERQSQEIASLTRNNSIILGAATVAPQEAPKSPLLSVSHPIPVKLPSGVASMMDDDVSPIPHPIPMIHR